MKPLMRSILRSLVVVAAASSATFTASSAFALPRTHDGFYLQLDAGLGYLSSSADIQGYNLKYSGLSFPTAILLGGTVGPVVIGGGFVTDYAPSPSVKMSGGGVTQTGDLTGAKLYLFSIGLFADIYPDPHSGLHFQPFLGWGGLQMEYQGVTGRSATGLVLAAGVGYDWWVADEWSIGVMGRFGYAPLNLDSVSYKTITPALLATFTYH
jgi:hypothetical protein